MVFDAVFGSLGGAGLPKWVLRTEYSTVYVRYHRPQCRVNLASIK